MEELFWPAKHMKSLRLFPFVKMAKKKKHRGLSIHLKGDNPKCFHLANFRLLVINNSA